MLAIIKEGLSTVQNLPLLFGVELCILDKQNKIQFSCSLSYYLAVMTNCTTQLNISIFFLMA